MSDYNPQDPADPGAPMRWTSSSTHVPSPNVQATMHQMTEQLQTVIDAAERAAEAIRYDAEEQARRHLAEAQRKADQMTAERVGLISELTDDLVRHAARAAPVGDVASTPWFAVGGLDAGNLDQVVEAGARRVVVVRAITEAADPEAAARTLRAGLPG